MFVYWHPALRLGTYLSNRTYGPRHAFGGDRTKLLTNPAHVSSSSHAGSLPRDFKPYSAWRNVYEKVTGLIGSKVLMFAIAELAIHLQVQCRKNHINEIQSSWIGFANAQPCTHTHVMQTDFIGQQP